MSSPAKQQELAPVPEPERQEWRGPQPPLDRQVFELDPAYQAFQDALVAEAAALVEPAEDEPAQPSIDLEAGFRQFVQGVAGPSAEFIMQSSRIIKNLEAEVARWKGLEQQLADEVARRRAYRKHFEDKAARARRILTREMGDLRKARDELLQTYTSASKKARFPGYCRTHDGVHFETDDCVGWYVDELSVPKEQRARFLRYTIEPNRQEAKAAVKAGEMLDFVVIEESRTLNIR